MFTLVLFSRNVVQRLYPLSTAIRLGHDAIIVDRLE